MVIVPIEDVLFDRYFLFMAKKSEDDGILSYLPLSESICQGDFKITQQKRFRAAILIYSDEITISLGDIINLRTFYFQENTAIF